MYKESQYFDVVKRASKFSFNSKVFGRMASNFQKKTTEDTIPETNTITFNDYTCHHNEVDRGDETRADV